jgi:two-component system CheB/CheR fusion protein
VNGSESEPGYNALIEFLRRSRGFDFSGYKRPTLERRFRRRMDVLGCKDYGDYLDYSRCTPTSTTQLFETLLINVTEFFRDPRRGSTCASGAARAARRQGRRRAGARVERRLRERAGGLHGAMVLAEMLGLDAYRERVKIYATDIDEDALAQARLATYSLKEIETVPATARPLLRAAGPALAFRKDLRRTVIFGRNNLVQDAPISRLDLLICRNTLMYFNAETQAGSCGTSTSRCASGVLMLGKSEMMISHRELFARTDSRSGSSQAGRARASRVAGSPARGAGCRTRGRPLARDAALEVGPTPS